MSCKSGSSYIGPDSVNQFLPKKTSYVMIQDAPFKSPASLLANSATSLSKQTPSKVMPSGIISFTLIHNIGQTVFQSIISKIYQRKINWGENPMLTNSAELCDFSYVHVQQNCMSYITIAARRHQWYMIVHSIW